MESERCTDCRQSLPIVLLEERGWLWHDVAGPRFPISFSLAESCARGGNWVSLGEGIKQSQISCHWWQRLCSSAHWAVLSHMVTHMVVLLASIPVLGFQRFCSQQMMKMRFEPPPVKEKNLFSLCARSTSGSQSSSLLRITPFLSHMVPQHFIWKRADTHELAVIPLPHLLKGDDSRAIFEDGRICLEKRMLEL